MRETVYCKRLELYAKELRFQFPDTLAFPGSQKDGRRVRNTKVPAVKQALESHEH